MTQDSKLVDISAELRHETYKAYLIHDGAKQVWLPKSQCEIYRDTGRGTAVVVTLEEWLAKDKGLI